RPSRLLQKWYRFLRTPQFNIDFTKAVLKDRQGQGIGYRIGVELLGRLHDPLSQNLLQPFPLVLDACEIEVSENRNDDAAGGLRQPFLCRVSGTLLSLGLIPHYVESNGRRDQPSECTAGQQPEEFGTADDLYYRRLGRAGRSTVGVRVVLRHGRSIRRGRFARHD